MTEEMLVMWHMGNGWGWWMALGWVGMVLMMALIVWAVYALMRRGDTGRGEAEHTQEPSALALLERRYARGDISTQEFEEMRVRLQSPTLPSTTAADR
ncbi:MAG: SHOCT domain-containing protein [Dehalococcoidia bacterium]